MNPLHDNLETGILEDYYMDLLDCAARKEMEAILDNLPLLREKLEKVRLRFKELQAAQFPKLSPVLEAQTWALLERLIQDQKTEE